MAKRGTRKYRCGECGAESFHHWIERNRAARMRCPGCGSARLELCAEEAKADQVSLNRVAVDGHRDMTSPKPERSKRRKVT